MFYILSIRMLALIEMSQVVAVIIYEFIILKKDFARTRLNKIAIV